MTMDEFTIVLDEVPISGGTLIPTPPLIFRTSVDRESLMIVTIHSEFNIDGENVIYEAFDRNADILFLEYLNDL